MHKKITLFTTDSKIFESGGSDGNAHYVERRLGPESWQWDIRFGDIPNSVGILNYLYDGYFILN